MQWWQSALLLLALVWGLQAFGTWRQMRHYQEVMRGITGRWSDGFVAAGNARGAIGKGVILLLVVTPDEIVRRLLIMEGRSVFAKFRDFPEFEGRALASLEADAFPAAERGRQQALAQAIAQVRRMKQERSAPAEPALAGA